MAPRLLMAFGEQRERYRSAAEVQPYARGGMSVGAAAHQAGVSQSELARHAYARGMEPPFSKVTIAIFHPRVSKPVTISGKRGDDARDYQEKAVRLAIEEAQQ